MQRKQQVRIRRKDLENEKQMVSKLREQLRQTEEAKLALEDDLRSRDARTAGDNEANKVLMDTVSKQEHEISQFRRQLQALNATVTILEDKNVDYEKQNPGPATNDEIANATSAAEIVVASPIEPKLSGDPQGTL